MPSLTCNDNDNICYHFETKIPLSVIIHHTHYDHETLVSIGKGKGRTLDIAPQVDIATTKALRHMARTKQRRTYLPYTFPAIAGTHLPTPRGWMVK